MGLALGAAYMAGGLARTASDHSRAARLAEAASDGFSETALQVAAARMDTGVLRIARRHDPFTVAGPDERDRQSAILAARLERSSKAAVHNPDRELLVRANFAPVKAATPFRFSGAMEASRDLECLTQAVYYEARGETVAGQRAVAQVVLNRVNHPAFPKTVCGVVYQGAARRTGCQFSFACNGAMNRGPEAGAWSRAQKIAMRALSGAVMAEVGNATHFHTTGVSPAWGPRLLRVGQVGVHIFYRFGRNSMRVASKEPAAPELTSEPVYAAPTPSLADVAQSDLRLTSLVSDPAAQARAADAAGTDAAAKTPAKPAKAATSGDKALADKAPAKAVVDKAPAKPAADAPRVETAAASPAPKAAHTAAADS